MGLPWSGLNLGEEEILYLLVQDITIMEQHRDNVVTMLWQFCDNVVTMLRRCRDCCDNVTTLRRKKLRFITYIIACFPLYPSVQLHLKSSTKFIQVALFWQGSAAHASEKNIKPPARNLRANWHRFFAEMFSIANVSHRNRWRTIGLSEK